MCSSACIYLPTRCPAACISIMHADVLIRVRRGVYVFSYVYCDDACMIICAVFNYDYNS